MARNKSMIARYINEFSSPVVMMVTSAEAEKVSLRNGLLLHELLSAFSHVDGVNSLLRLPGMNINVSDCHLRFERSTEMHEKSGEILEQLLQRDFEDFDMQHVPSDVNGLRNAPPTGWSRNVEELVMRSLSFNECEMMSAPLMIMTVVSTSDADPLGSLEELNSNRHSPPCFSNGQYDLSTHRIFVVVHDTTAINPQTNAPYDVNEIMKSIYRRYPPPRTKIMTLNSLPSDAPNIHQPDMWSRWMIPRFFPHLCTVLDSGEHAELSREPSASSRGEEKDMGYYGKYLSMEDFMNLREFCTSLFQHEIMPALERRIVYLSKSVKENKKGVQNLFKSFMRKPREDLISGRYKGIRYSYERIEAQILMLADTYFSLGAYDEAVSMYKLVKDDFKSDKSTMHEAYCLFQLIMRLSINQPIKVKERKEYIDQLHHLILSGQVPAPYPAFFATIVSEALVIDKQQQFPLDAAQMLLGAAGSVQKYPLLCALLTERAASLYLRAGRFRRFAMQEIMCGQRFQTMPGKMTKHAAICYAAALVVYDTGQWSAIKSRTTRRLIDIIMEGGVAPSAALDSRQGGSSSAEQRTEGARRAFLLMIRLLDQAVTGRSRALGAAAYEDATRIVKEISQLGPWGTMHVSSAPVAASSSSSSLSIQQQRSAGGREPPWVTCTALDIINGKLPLISAQPPAAGPGDAGPGTDAFSVVEGLNLPQIDTQWLRLMNSTNGVDTLHTMADGDGAAGGGGMHSRYAGNPEAVIASMERVLNVEVAWAEQQLSASDHVNGGARGMLSALVEAWAEADVTSANAGTGRTGGASSANLRGLKDREKQTDGHHVPLGECVVVKLRLRNKLPIPLPLRHVQLRFDRQEIFLSPAIEASIQPGCWQDLHVAAQPTQEGFFTAEEVQWRVGSALMVAQALVKPGELLHKSLSQRVNRARGPDRKMVFSVGPAYPNLKLELQGMPVVPLCAGELLWGTLLLTNQGGAPAHNLYLKLSQPWCTLYADATLPVVGGADCNCLRPNTSLLLPVGKSGTLFRASEGTVVAPGGSIKFGVLLRFPSAGRKKKLSFLASYNSLAGPNSTLVPFGDKARRTSFLPLSVVVLRGQRLDLQTVNFGTELLKKTLVVKLSNEAGGPSSNTNANTNVIGSGAGSAATASTRVESITSFGPLGCVQGEASVALAQMSRDYSDSVTHCVPVSVEESGRVCELLSQSSSTGGASREDTSLLSAMMSNAIVASRFRRLSSDRFTELKTQLYDQDAAGPRSIADVRRENRKKSAHGDDVDDNDGEGEEGAAPLEQDPDLSFEPSTDPQALANLEAKAKAISIAVLWSKEGSTPNSRRFGLSWSFHVPFLDVVLASLKHPAKMSLPRGAGSVRIPISLELRATNQTPLTASVEAADLSLLTAYAETDCAASVETPLPVNRGMRWVGKTAYKDVALEPNLTRKFVFSAIASRCGVFDLGRFKLSIVGNTKESSRTILDKQSLVEIVPANDDV